LRLYEAMFVVNQNAAKENYEKVEAEALDCITRHGGEIVNSLRWDDRRLAYDMNRQRRATFILVHFNAPTESIDRIERQARLCEVVLRVLIVVDEDGPVAEPAPKGRDSEFEETRGRGRRRERRGRERERSRPREESRAEEGSQPAQAQPPRQSEAPAPDAQGGATQAQ